MRLILLTALLASAGAAQAQPGYDPGYYPPPGCPDPGPPPPARNTMPVYRDGRLPPPPPGGGYHDSYGTADVAADQSAADAVPPGPPAMPGGKRDPHYARSHYAARIAQWRARANACEAGDIGACQSD